jgi:phenylalanyl-tRNA synthetase beta chain
MPLVEYMGDAVLEIAIMPNIARDANILGIAREIAALTGQKLRDPRGKTDPWKPDAPSIEGRAAIEIRQPEFNPRFVLGLIENIEIKPSPYEIQRRLRLSGMRPINNIVDATNYAMWEIGEPLHAFDYDILVQRASDKASRPGTPPTIITRTAQQGERLTTLDDIEHILDDFTVLVCDTAGALSIAGIMGGAESEVNASTRSVLLEGAAWNFINIRRTLSAQRMSSEAAYRFSRGVHPAMASHGVRRGLELMQSWSGGLVSKGLIDNYPLPPLNPTVEITTSDVKRWLGIELSPDEVSSILTSLEFKVQISGQTIRATTPDHRLDIGQGVIGKADLMEEIARVYGYDRIPETRMADALPPQRGNPGLEREERVRDVLVNLGLQEVIGYRLTSPERESRLYPPASGSEGKAYVRLVNPISSDRVVMRRSLLASVLDVVERNSRLQERLALFEIGPVFIPSEKEVLPEELVRLAFVLTGPRDPRGWQPSDTGLMDFYDLKGVASALLEALHLPDIRFEPAQDPAFHPGKYARLLIGQQELGVLGELHPLVVERYDLPDIRTAPILAAEFYLQPILDSIPERYPVQPVPAFPPVLEDLAIVIEEDVPAERVAEVIRAAGGDTVSDVRLFDVYRGEQAGAGMKSLAYSLTYLALDRTLTDQEVAAIRHRIVRSLEKELGAKLRS